ncbi:hypothetical protein BurJ1DRAFT_0937 [Burkholderiales bacterium JOSHI_001]|nr:hypothetical protein BurJ1DRAFT_0937 [Burkholderiales bacterium JOSHI_001]
MSEAARAARRRLLLLLAGLAARPLCAQPQSPSEQRLQQLMQARSATLDASARRERLDLLAQGEALLAAGDLDAAQAAFDRAALMLHAADTEIALVRCYMQRGEYQRAISFGAHAAGAHREVSAAAVLYAWLLQRGGQGAFAARLLDEALQLRPDDFPLAEARAALDRSALQESWLAGPLPVRLGPLALGDRTVPATARVAGSATLAGPSGQVLAPLTAVQDAAGLWLRDGLGRTTAARVQQRWPDLGLALLQGLSWAGAAAPVWVARDGFPGSPAHALEHPAAASAAPGWPQLTLGFLGGLRTDETRSLGIDLPNGPHGGPVIDGQGRLLGVAIAHGDGSTGLVPASRLRSRLDLALPPTASTPSRLALAAVYEQALPLTLQVLVA